MKTKLPIILMALALPLLSCGGQDSNDISSETEEPSSETSEIITGGDGHDEQPIDGTYETWPADDIAQFFLETAGYEGSIPTPSEELQEGKSFEIIRMTDIDAYGDEKPSLAITVNGDFSAFGSEIIDQGWLEPGSAAFYDARLFNSPDLALELILTDFDENDGNTYIYIEPSITGFTALYPTAAVEKAMAAAIGEGATPLPEIPDASLYYLDLTGINDGYFDFWIYDVDPDVAEGLFSEMGFPYNPSLSASNYSHVYVEPAINYYVEINLSNYENYKCFCMEVSIPENIFYTDWANAGEAIAGYIESIASSNFVASLPEPDVDWDLIYLVTDTLTSRDPYFYYYMFTYAEDGSYIDITEDIAGQFDESSQWVYVEDEDGYVDKGSASILVKITDRNIDSYGTRVIIYSGSYTIPRN